MTTQDKVKVIAEYDGWVKQPAARAGSFYYQKGDRIKICNNEDLPYATSLDWLHPVAMKVFDDLQEIKPVVEVTGSPIYYMGKDLLSRCGNKPINGEYIDLFNSIYDGIVFLNSNNQPI